MEDNTRSGVGGSSAGGSTMRGRTWRGWPLDALLINLGGLAFVLLLAGAVLWVSRFR